MKNMCKYRDTDGGCNLDNGDMCLHRDMDESFDWFCTLEIEDFEESGKNGI